MRPLLIIGAGGHAKVVAAAAQAAGFVVTHFFDDNPARWGAELMGVPIEGPAEAALRHDGQRIIAVGDNRRRMDLARRLGGEGTGEEPWATVVHPTAWIHASVSLGAGTVVMAGAVLQPDVRIGGHAIVNTGASLDHDTVVGAGTHVAPGARLAGVVNLGEGVLFGIGAVAIPGVKVGDWATVGAGAAVVSDVSAGETVAGVPARPLKGEESKGVAG